MKSFRRRYHLISGKLIVLIVLSVMLLFVSTGCQSRSGADIAESEDTTEVGSSPAGGMDGQPLTSADKELLEALKEYRFFKGTVVIEEAQQWQSKFEDASHGEGNATLEVQELVVYDPTTQKAYIAVRSLAYNSQHTVTVNDPRGNFIGSQPVSASGTLVECYGFGLEGTKEGDNKLDLSVLPLRIDQLSESFYTRPATLNAQWVAYRSTADSVRWSIERIGPPEVAKDPQLAQIMTLDQFSNKKTYGNRESAIYEATRRLWQVKGSVEYQYERIEASEALNELMRRLGELPEANSFVMPTALDANAADLLPQWEVLTALARYSYQAVAAGQQIIWQQSAKSETHSSTNSNTNSNTNTNTNTKTNVESNLVPKAVLEAYQQLYDDALINLIQLLDTEGTKPKANSLSNFIEGSSFINAFTQHLEAIKQSGNLSPLIGYLQSYEESVQRIADSPSQPSNKRDQESAIIALLKTDFEGNSEKALDLAADLPLPEGYPEEILPIFKEGRVVIAELLEENTYSVSFIDVGPKEKVIDFYRGLLKKYKDFSQFELQGNTILTANRSPWALSITIAPNQMTDEGGYIVNLMLVPLDN